MLKDIYIEMRPSHWVKNLIIFLPLIFSNNLFNGAAAGRSIIAFISFCFIASFVYLINDIYDIEHDRSHDKKRQRPIAAGTISPNRAIVISLVLLILGLFLALFVSKAVFMFIGIYVVINLIYSLYLKHFFVIDIITLASFYMLRLAVGSAAIEITITPWLFVATFLLAITLIFGKRRTEYLSHKVEGKKTRIILDKYSVNILDISLWFSILMFFGVYVLYSFLNQGGLFLTTIPVVAMGCYRYLYLVYRLGVGEEPERIIFTDKVMAISVGIWLVLVILGVYF